VKDLSGHATATTEAPLENCLALVEAVEAYPSWYPEVVRSVDVLERNEAGRATTVRTKLHLSQGPLSRDFELRMAVEVQGSVVRLSRIAEHGRDGEQFEVRWSLAAHLIELDLKASLDVPRLLPIGGIGDSVAEGFVNAAVNALGA
jgi:ribosome-associated toxin RatA of RatAB toxin-antitoxin module